MPWTQATDPSGDVWTGRCNQLDRLTMQEPQEPADFDSSYVTDVHLMDGFEYPVAIYNGSNEALWDATVEGAGGASIVAARSTTLTAGNALQIASTTVDGLTLQNFDSGTTPTFQYYRIYFKIVSFTNTNGSERTYNIGGWTDNTGHRSTIVIVLPALAGSNPKIGVGQNQSGSPTTVGTVSLSTGTWYRGELTTESLSGGGGMTSMVKLYLGDTTTLVDSVSINSVSLAMGGYPFIAVASSNTGNAITVAFDDLRVQSSHRTEAAAATGLPLYGPGGIWNMYPSSESTSEWTPLTGTDNSAMVDEFPAAVFDDDTTYNTSAGTSALIDTYGVSFFPSGTFPSASMFIKAVSTRIRYKNPSGSSPTVNAVYVDPSEVTFLGSDAVMSGSNYEVLSYSFLIYPTGQPVEFANLQGVGIKRVAGAFSTTIRCTSCWGLMDIAQEPD